MALIINEKISSYTRTCAMRLKLRNYVSLYPFLCNSKFDLRTTLYS